MNQLAADRASVARFCDIASARWLDGSEAAAILASVAASLMAIPSTPVLGEDNEPISGSLCLTLQAPSSTSFLSITDERTPEDRSFRAQSVADPQLERRAWSASRVGGPWLMQYMRMQAIGGPPAVLIDRRGSASIASVAATRQPRLLLPKEERQRYARAAEEDAKHTAASALVAALAGFDALAAARSPTRTPTAMVPAASLQPTSAAAAAPPPQVHVNRHGSVSISCCAPLEAAAAPAVAEMPAPAPAAFDMPDVAELSAYLQRAPAALAQAPTPPKPAMVSAETQTPPAAAERSARFDVAPARTAAVAAEVVPRALWNADDAPALTPLPSVELPLHPADESLLTPPRVEGAASVVDTTAVVSFRTPFLVFTVTFYCTFMRILLTI